MPRVQNFDGFEVPHDARQILESVPEGVQFRDGPIDGDGAFDFHVPPRVRGSAVMHGPDQETESWKIGVPQLRLVNTDGSLSRRWS
jgi:hypothetical protein